MSGGQLGQLSQVRPPVGLAPGAQPGGSGPPPLMATAGQGMPPMGTAQAMGMPQQQQVPWSPAFPNPQPFAGAKPNSTPFYPPLQGGFYNQMTQRLAGPGYTPIHNPYNAINGPAQGGRGGYGGGYGFAPGGGFNFGPGGGYGGYGR